MAFSNNPYARFHLLALLALLSAACSEAPSPSTPPGPSPGANRVTAAQPPLTFVGSQACADCHTEAYRAWQGSHHQLAMQAVTKQSVLGDFSGLELAHFDDTYSFRLDQGKPVIAVAEGQGAAAEHAVTHAFGIEPLQQYLVALPGGRYQIPSIAWDTRSPAQGGQRWFHLYPDEPIPSDDGLHWTGELFNWNSQCAECHVTGFRKNYTAGDDRYDSEWAELGVGCEACHGRGSRHIAWAKAAQGKGKGQAHARSMGLELRFNRRPHQWVMSADTERGIAARQPAIKGHRQSEACGRCHARRTTRSDYYPYGRPLLDSHRPALIEPELYFADGQIRDEVFVYGSFLQSRMYQAGVECSDCHQAHSTQLKIEGDGLCGQCHLPTRFANADHHRHGETTVACVDCHTPARSYMVVDPRRDHSFRVPRPDLTVDLNTPNACNGCHTDQSAAWAASTVAGWYPQGRGQQPHYGHALAAAWNGAAGGVNQALTVATDADYPPFVRASAMAALRGQTLGPPELERIAGTLKTSAPMIRFGALQALGHLPPQVTVPLALPLLDHGVKAVRIEAARLTAPADGRLSPADQRLFERAAGELMAAERYNFDREFGRLNAANFTLARGQARQAVTDFNSALKAYPESTILRVNLADALRVLDRNEEGVDILQEARNLAPDDEQVREALALALVRVQRHADAVEELKAWRQTQPDNARAGVLLVLALDSIGAAAEAAALIEQLKRQHPNDNMVQSTRLSPPAEQG